MKNAVWAASLLTAATFAAPSAGAQTFQNGPYYANPSWDQHIPAGQRFIVLSNWGNAAVLDRETGLVWQRSPNGVNASWFGSAGKCHSDAATGNRLGWRLPSVEELASLVDRTQSNPALPPGHP